ncbi:MAG: hypothetical protein AAGA43_16860 [Bacteroidota bacterium]|nr:hypothetical protein [uncultured Allomuricauda sp.]
MIIKRLLFAAVFILAVSTNISCEKEDVTETELEVLSVKKSEIEEGDT